MKLRVIQWNIKRSGSPAIETFLKQRVAQGPTKEHTDVFADCN